MEQPPNAEFGWSIALRCRPHSPTNGIRRRRWPHLFPHRSARRGPFLRAQARFRWRIGISADETTSGIRCFPSSTISIGGTAFPMTVASVPRRVLAPN
jgi:hypothetical protein